MATVNITTSQNLTAVTYVAGDTLNISNGATLTINSTPSLIPAAIQCNTFGTCLVTNASTTTPIVLTLTNTASRLTFQQRGIFQVRGAAIVLYTGDGTASQTIANFTTKFSGVIDYPAYVEVETGSGTGIYRPWYVIPNANFTTTYAKALFGSGDLGNVLFYDGSTKILSAGDGTNGNVIPNGARVRMPNIHITAGANTATITARAQASSGAGGGEFDCEWAEFSNAFYLNLTSFYNTRLQHVGNVGFLNAPNVQLFNWSYVISSTDPQNSSQSITLSSLGISPMTLDHIYGQTAAGGGVSITRAAQGSTFDTIEGHTIARTGTGSRSILFINIDTPTTLKNLTGIGDHITFQSTKNAFVQTVRHSDTATGSSITTNATTSLDWTNCQNMVFYDVGQTSPAGAPRNTFFLDDAISSGIVIHNFTLDGKSNTSNVMQMSGNRETLANGTINNVVTGIIVNNLTQRLALRNVRNNNNTSNLVTSSGTLVDFLQASTIAVNPTNALDVSNFAVTANSTPTAGTLVVGPFTIKNQNDLYDITGSAQPSNQGALLLPGAGDVVVLKTIAPIRGITSFQNSAPTVSGTNTGTLTFEFRVANWTANGIRSWSSWNTLNGSNLSSALSGLSGYSNTTGFDLQVRVTSGAADATRNLTKIVLLTNTNSSYAPSPASVDINLAGAANGTVYGLFDNTTPASPVLVDIDTAAAAGTASCQLEHPLDGTTKAYLVRVRKLGYFSKDITGGAGFLGATVPASQVSSVVDVSAGASVTGVSVDHTTQTVTVTTSHTIAEVYAYVQYDLATVANIDKSNYLETTDGTNYTMSYNLTVNNCNLTGTANISMPTKAFTLSGSATTTCVVTDSSGTNGFLVLSGLSAHAVYVKDNSGTQKLYSASITGSTTVYIPTGSSGSWTYVIKKAGYKHQIGTIAASTGGTFTITASTPQKLNSDGTAMYLGTTSSLVQVTFSGTTYAYIDIGDGLAPLQAAFDETEDALVTNNGMIWLGAGKDDTSQFNSGGGDFLFLSTGWRLRRWHTTDDNATIQAFVSSVDGTPIDGSNGLVAFLSTDTPETIAAAVHQYTVEGAYTFDELVRLMTASLAGKLSGAAGTTITIRDILDTKNRIVATVDSDGNRTAVTLDAS